MQEPLKLIIEHQTDFLKFLKTRYNLFHLSNVFFRDLHYGVMRYLEWKQVRSTYAGAEHVTKEIVDEWIRAGILKNVGHMAYTLHYPEFKKPPVKPAAPSKPAAPGVSAAKGPVPSARPATGAAPAAKPAQSAAIAPSAASAELQR